MIDYDIYIDDIIDVLNDADIPGVGYLDYEFRDGFRYIVFNVIESGISEEWMKEIKRVCREFGEHDLIFEEI